MQDSINLSVSNNSVLTESFELGCVDCFEKNDALWFRLSDIGEILGVSKGTISEWLHGRPSSEKSNSWFDKEEVMFKRNEHGGHDIPYVSESALYRILNRSNSPKAKPFERWVTKEVIPTIRKTGSYTIPGKSKEELATMEHSNRIAEANFYAKLAEKYSHNKDYEQILDAYATKALEGKFVLPLPKLEEENFSATEAGKMLGISANKFGSIAIKMGLKVDGEYGKWYVDKARNSNKEVNTFRYTQKAIDMVRSSLD